MLASKSLLAVFIALFSLLFAACNQNGPNAGSGAERIAAAPLPDPQLYMDTSLTESLLHEKVLGFLVGSAIGDAMGAPTEMWTRESIEMEYGFVNSLDKLVREASPEGPWDFNLAPGGTTDDTRWKELAFRYLLREEGKRSRRQPPLQDSRHFAEYIVDLYLEDIEQLKNVDSFHPEPFEINARKMTWLQEWALVAKPYLENDLDGYARAVNRFYGGDLSCAGMLYAPAVGAFYPGRPKVAYEEAYKLGIFDLGYARDLSSLTAAMTAAAFVPGARTEDIMNVIRDVDPNDYFKSRLIGRTAYRLLRQARSIIYAAKQATMDEWKELDLHLPSGYARDSLYFVQTSKAYDLLENQLQDVPFHAAEIFLINITALLFADMDFQKSLEFITNFGRDNDTSGAVAGAILGAHLGFSRLPAHLVEQVLQTNKKDLGIDLQELARTFTQALLERKGN